MPTTSLSNEVLVFRTDIKTRKKVKVVKPVLNNHPRISRWSVDTEDIDNVLRIETLYEMEEEEIIFLIRACGFYCEELSD